MRTFFWEATVGTALFGTVMHDAPGRQSATVTWANDKDVVAEG
jgi:hypothetical protein